MSFMDELRERVDAYLDKVMAESVGVPEPLKSAIEYSLLGGGKRLRPIALLVSNEMFGGDPEEAMPYAVAIEAIHAGSLVHDDMPAMDDDDMRRGKPSCHKQFTEGMALLAGDALLTLAIELMSDAAVKHDDNAHNHVKAIRCVAYAAGKSGMCAGQCMDISHDDGNIDEQELIELQLNKTGALLGASFCAGALLAGASAEDAGRMEAFGKLLGVIFQMQDDLLDEIGDAAVLGKQVRKDVDKGKLTFVSLLGVEGAEQRIEKEFKLAEAMLEPYGERAVKLRFLLQALRDRSS